MKNLFEYSLLIVLAFFFGLDSMSQTESETLIPYRKGNKWGYMNTSGEMVVKAKYEETYPFENNLGRVKMNGKYGFINPIGEIKIPFKYSAISDFTNGMAYLTDTLLYLDTLGMEHITKAHCGGSYINRDEYRVFERDGYKGVLRSYPMDTIIFPKYIDIQIFDYMDVFAVKDSTEKYGIVSISDSVIQPFIYDTVFVQDIWVDHWLQTKIGNSTGAIHPNGELAAEAKYLFINKSKYCFYVGLKGGRTGFVYNRKEYWKH